MLLEIRHLTISQLSSTGPVAGALLKPRHAGRGEAGHHGSRTHWSRVVTLCFSIEVNF